MNGRLRRDLAAGLGVLVLATGLAISKPSPVAQAIYVPARPPLTAKQQVIGAALVKGYSSTEVRCLVRLVYRESRWNPKAQNPRSSASGLFQHLRSPSGVRLADLSIPKQTERGLRYIDSRYGSACKALQYHLRNGHY